MCSDGPWFSLTTATRGPPPRWPSVNPQLTCRRSYMPLSGFHGVISGFLVGIKQIIPDQELPYLKIKIMWLPSITVLCSIAMSFWTIEATTYLPTVIFGTYMSWIYLRYWQRIS